MKYYVLLFEAGKRDNILKVISEPVEEKTARQIMEQQNKVLNLEEHYADMVKA